MFLLILVAAALAGCGRSGETTRCDAEASSAVVFSAPDANDAVEARAIGADCGAAVAVLAVRSHEGVPIYAWAAPMHPTFGDSFAPRVETPLSRQEMQAFLDRWAAAASATTGAAPAWHEGIVTPFSRETYEDIRDRNAPMLCFLSSVARETCIYWESGVAAAGVLAERDAPGAAAPDERFLPGQTGRE
ncbi:MAG: hypothetical protein GC206_11770 [Alphaproteobacteria bacterium]|nr:hypothetical protein [Alphaproteobacteria bacterium]